MTGSDVTAARLFCPFFQAWSEMHLIYGKLTRNMRRAM